LLAQISLPPRLNIVHGIKNVILARFTNPSPYVILRERSDRIISLMLNSS
jgi:hypothetical protein